MRGLRSNYEPTSECVVERDVPLSSRNRAFQCGHFLLPKLRQAKRCVLAPGCNHKRSATSSVFSVGGVALFVKSCALETIFSSCFMILAVSAGFLNPTGSGPSSSATARKHLMQDSR